MSSVSPTLLTKSMMVTIAIDKWGTRNTGNAPYTFHMGNFAYTLMHTHARTTSYMDDKSVAHGYRMRIPRLSCA